MIAVALLWALAQDDLTVFKPEDQPRKMLYAYLQGECAKQFDERRKAVAALKTPEDVKKRQELLRARFIEAIGGYPERTPLNAKVVGTVEGDGFRIEKVIYESRPDHHVTALFYVPAGKGPFPGVLLPCGHGDKGKAEEAYQRASILLAKNGVAVLCYDPIGQGERNQLLDAQGKPVIKNTTEHTMIGIGALLVGWSTASFRIWDGIRSIDYLASRPEVDPKRLGCTGNSGGGTMTAYLMALDERIACAAPSCYVTTLERLFATIGPQDAEQNITGQVAFGMEQTDYVTMRAPKPTLICTATQDFFDIQGSWTTFREAKQIYGLLGHAERVDLIEYNDKHGFSRPRREAATRWMRRWLLGVDDAPAEPEFAVFKEEELRCTKSGQVLVDFKGKSAFDLDVEREKQLAAKRAAMDRETLMASIARTIGLKLPLPPNVQDADLSTTSVPRAGYVMAKGTVRIEPGIRLSCVVMNPGGTKPVILAISSEGKSPSSAVGGPLEKRALAGHPVAAVDLRGYGETAPDEKKNPFGLDWKEAFLGIHLDRPLLGQRVYDVLRLMDPKRENHLVASGAAVPVALHAAALSPVQEVTLEGGIVSWSSVVKTPVTQNQLANVVPGALALYDLPDLAALIAPRKLTILSPVDPAGKPVSQAELEAAYAKAREAYRAAGAEAHLVLKAAP